MTRRICTYSPTDKSLRDLDDPILNELASKLPDTIMVGRTNATTRKYIGAFRRRKVWAEAILAKDFQIELYLQHLADTSKFKATVDEACNVLAWVHSAAGLASLTTFPFLCSPREGLQRSLAKPVVKKSPVTVEMLEVMARDA